MEHRADCAGTSQIKPKEIINGRKRYCGRHHGRLNLLGMLISNNAKTAVMEEKIENLTREVREHNNFAKRVPIIEEQMKVVNHYTRNAALRGYNRRQRITDLIRVQVDRRTT